ncbi:MAG TPA: glucosaminidase domain-containing protein [Saprospiraceae bacterium]|nr:glucosaminidase domain-containing protein [Saprospiraceae bacterium]HMQ81561.1 glucosaminidase domain-containing protein [Saprospiraceae bacterium]
MKLFRPLFDALSHLANGFFLTFFFCLSVLVGLHLYQNKWEAVKTLPIIWTLTDAWERGVENVGGLSAEAVRYFYEKEFRQVVESSPGKEQRGKFLLEDGQEVRIRSTWSERRVMEKLQKNGFSEQQIKDAKKFLTYVEKYKALAIRDMMTYKVPASIKLAQGILESGAGTSELSMNTNNHFGIKARAGEWAQRLIRERRFEELQDGDFRWVSPAIGAYQMTDDNHYDRFEVYRSVGDSYRRHTQLLTRPCTAGNVGCYAWIWSAYPVGVKSDIGEAARRSQGRTGYAPGDFFDGKTELPYYAACAAGLKMSGYATSKTYHQKLAFLIETYELWRFDLDVMKAYEQLELE